MSSISSIARQLARHRGVRQHVTQLVRQLGAELGRLVGREPLGDRRQHLVGGAAAIDLEAVGQSPGDAVVEIVGGHLSWKIGNRVPIGKW